MKPDFTLGTRGGDWYAFNNNRAALAAQKRGDIPWHAIKLEQLRVAIIRAGMSFETEE